MSDTSSREMTLEIARAMGGSLVAGVVLAFLGPFGSFEWNAPTRLAFWIICMLTGACIHLPAYHFGRRLGLARGLPAWVWLPLAALAAAIPMTLMVNGIAVSVFRFGAISGPVQLYPYVVTISLPVLCIVHLMEWVKAHRTNRTSQESPGAPVPDAASPEPLAAPSVTRDTPLLDTVPARLGKTILCLQMEDHYIRVHTDRGDAMLHGRMADFERELDGRIPGLRVHRSWWVARDAVTGWTRDGKTLTLTLKNALAVPVARDRQTELKAAGWLV